MLPKVLIYILFLLSFFNRAENLYAQTCYRWFDEQAGYAGNNIPVTLETAACSAKVAMTNDYANQFGVFSTAFYAHAPATFGTADPIFQATLAKIEAANPYYLVFSRITDNKIFTGINAAVRLPEGGIFHCLTEGDRLDIQRFVSERTQAVFQEHGMTPDAAIKAEEAGINKLKEILEKIAICCDSPGGCTFCPDLDKAIELRAYFENPDNCFVSIPIKIYTESPISKPGLKNNQKNNLTGSVENHTSIEVEFREGDDHGALSNVLNDVLNSDYFEDLSARGFITDNHYFCEEGNLEAIEESYSDEGFGVSVWAHIWHNPDDSTAQAYLYVASRNPAGDLCRIDRPDIVGELEHSFLVSLDGSEYSNKFMQSASVVFAYAATGCAGINIINGNYPTDNYGNQSDMELMCVGQTESTHFFLSPACQPIKLAKGTIPHFSNSVASEWHFDPIAIYGFTTGNGRWIGCGIRGDRFLGFYNFSKGIRRYEANNELNQSSYTVLKGYTDASSRTLKAGIYTPPSSRPPNQFATGVFISNFGSIPPTNPTYEINYSIVTDRPTIKELNESFWKAVQSPKKMKGTLFKVPTGSNGNTFLYYLCKYDVASGTNKFYQFSCAEGFWVEIPDPFVEGDGEIYIASMYGPIVLKSPAFQRWLNTLNPNATHEVLDMIGMICPAADVLNMVLYYVEGDNVNAVLCAVGVIPLVGEAVSGLKTLRFADEAVLPAYAEGKISKASAKVHYVEFRVPCASGNRPQNGDDFQLGRMSSNSVCLRGIDLGVLKQTGEYYQLTEAEFKLFLNDALDAETYGELAYQVINGSGHLVDAWKAVKNRPVIRKDLQSLTKISELLSDADFINKLPGKYQDFRDILDVVINPCCGQSHGFLKPLDIYLDEVKNVVKNYYGKPGFDQLISALKHSSPFMQDGVSFMIAKVNTIDPSTVQRFEGKIVEGLEDADNLEAVCTACRFDIELTSGKKIELKSYSENTINAIANSDKFRQQFKAYFQDPTSATISDFEYIFNAQKSSNMSLIKEKFKQIFQKNNYSFFDEIGGADNSVMDSLGINDIDDFIDIVDDTQSPIYSFIKLF